MAGLGLVWVWAGLRGVGSGCLGVWVSGSRAKVVVGSGNT